MLGCRELQGAVLFMGCGPLMGASRFPTSGDDTRSGKQ